MKYLAFILAFGLLISLPSCQKDILGDENVEEVITTEPTVIKTVSTGVSGIVTNESGNPLPNVNITYSRQEYTTDENGYFLIRDVNADKEGGILYMEEEGYFNNYKFFLPELNTTSFMRVIMVERNNPSSFNSETGGPIEISGGGLVTFPANSIKVESTGANYDGQVSVYTHWFNPEDSNISQSMPGDLRGLSAEGKLVQLSTYGMMAVELISENGEKLNLRDNTFAELKFPLPQDTRSHAPEIIETWSLDEETVYWEEENVAELDGNFYVTNVSHFSFWNCDVPYPLVNISGKLVNENGLPLSYYGICINALDRGQTGYGWSDNQGGFRGKVPKNERLELVIKDECGNVILRRNIGPFSNDVTLGELEIEIGGQIIINGQLMCSGIPITEGYAHVCLENGLCYVALVDDQGFFEQIINNCGTTSGISVQGFDTENLRSSEILSVNPNNSPIEIGIIEVCDELDEFIRFKIDGSNEALILNPSASIINGNLYIDAKLDSIETSFSAVILDASMSANNTVSNLEAYLLDNNNFLDARCTSVDNCIDITFEITSIGSVGDVVEGSFMGEIDGIVIMGSFRIIIDATGNPLNCSEETISGDCLGNPGSATIIIDGGIPPYEVFIDGISTGVQNETTYTITNLMGGDVLQYIISDSNNETCNGFIRIQLDTLSCDVEVINPTCSGNNGSITSIYFNNPNTPDLIEFLWNTGATTGRIEGLSAGLYTYTITDVTTGCTIECESELEEFGQLQVNMFQEDSIQCDPNNSLVYLDVLGGTAPYTFLWDDGNTDQQRSGLVTGTYSATVTDSDGCTGEITKFIEFINFNGLSCSISSTPTSCGGDNGTATATVNGGSGNYTYSWSNGATTQQITNLNSGVYTVIIVDRNGCETQCNVEIEDSGQLQVSILQEDFNCDPTSSFAYIEVFGGTQPYSYQWENGSTDQEVVGLPEGPVSVTVTDANGCTGEAIEFIEYQDQVEIEAQISSSITGCDQDGNPAGMLTIENTFGGVPPYTYLWSNASTTVMSESIGLSFQENIILTITDANGCSSSQDFVFNPENPRSISGTVWNDNLGNTDFLLDTLDGRIIDAEVFLYESSNLQDPIQLTTTDEFGYYIFSDLVEGSYVVSIPLTTPGANYVESNIGNNDNIDSEVDNQTGFTEIIEHDGCERITNINAGMQL